MSVATRASEVIKQTNAFVSNRLNTINTDDSYYRTRLECQDAPRNQVKKCEGINEGLQRNLEQSEIELKGGVWELQTELENNSDANSDLKKYEAMSKDLQRKLRCAEKELLEAAQADGNRQEEWKTKGIANLSL